MYSLSAKLVLKGAYIMTYIFLIIMYHFLNGIVFNLKLHKSLFSLLVFM